MAIRHQKFRRKIPSTIFVIFLCLAVPFVSAADNADEWMLQKRELKLRAHEMFMHAYGGYMEYAFPHDELMPISCKPRIRGVTPSRGDVDDSLGNFSLTLVDALDTLAVVGEYEEFAKAVRFIVDNVRFDADLVVSVFETNIRIVGGLISGHLLSILVKERHPELLYWYNGELLKMAAEVADRLMPAFNTTSGIPHPRVNLKRGMPAELKKQHDTCTACAGTMILEWAALSRLTGNLIYEEKARKAMDFLWNQRHRGSDLMGTVLNVHSGDWVRRDSGIGAGIDSYYEYTLKAYILLGEEDYLYRFNKHYDAVMRYLSKGPLFVDVHMHKPNIASRSYMDSLLAFWPGLQVLKGDLKGAIEMHEMLYLVVQKHQFLPEAFTHDLQVHWAQHPLRPEFLESTYLLYRATKDPHYLEVAQKVMDSLDENVRTSCGFASVKDVRTMEKEDQMESFVLSETFKYLYMIFAEPNDLLFDPDNYVLTTEAHFLPLSMAELPNETVLPRRLVIDPDEVIGEEVERRYRSACPNVASDFKSTDELSAYGSSIRGEVNRLLNHITSPITEEDKSATCSKTNERLKAWAFSVTNANHLEELKKMGIEIQVQSSGRIQLTHSAELNGQPGPSSSCTIEIPALPEDDASYGNSQRLFHSSKTALIQMTGFIMLIFLLWVVLLVASMSLICIVGLTYRYWRKRSYTVSTSASESEDDVRAKDE
jgi:mannosidase alpha-like ER degradation enhancer 3